MRFPFLHDARFYHASGVLVATMIGAGLYGIPFAFAKAGFWVGTAWLVALAVGMGLFNLLFAELTLLTPGTHQVTGYIHAWLGPWGRRLSTVAYVLSMYGALLAYIILMGEFLTSIFSHVVAIDPQWYSVLFALTGALIWLLRIKTIARIELAFIGFYTVAVLCIVLFGMSSVRIENFSGWTPDFWYLPYGVLFFALAGMSVIPIQRQLLAGRERLFRPVIVSAMLFVSCLYLLFAFVVVGVSGDATSPAALAGLYEFLGTPILLLGALLGVLTVSTSYVILGTALLETFHTDYRQRMPIAWILAVTPPVVLFMAGVRNFIEIIGLVGAVALGTQSVLLLIAYLRARRAQVRTPEFRVGISSFFVILLGILFAAGVLFDLFSR